MKNLCAFTLLELLVVLMVVALLLSVAFPVFNTVPEKALAPQDLNKLCQLGIATQMHLNDSDSVLFSSGGIWMTFLHPKYLSNWKIFQPSFDKRAASESDAAAPVSYGLNGHGDNGASIAGLGVAL